MAFCGNAVAADVRLAGDFGRKLEACYRGSVRTADAKRFTDAFATQTETTLWQTEFWGKWMHAAVPLAVYFGDEELKRKISASADAMRSHQLADGYLGNYAPEARAGYRTWDLWGAKYTLLGFLFEHDLTGNPKALEACARLVDYTFGEIKARKLDLCRTGSHMGMATLSMLEPLVKLYDRTGEKRYRDAIDIVLHEMNGCEKGPFLVDKALAGVHVSDRFPLHEKWWWVDNGMKAYEMMSCYQGLFEYWKGMRDEGRGMSKKSDAVFDACVATANDILAREIGIIGSGGIMECWCHFQEHEGRYITGATETCITTTWMRLLASLLRETDDAAYADALESAAYNAFSAAMKRDGTGWVQYLPENGRRGEGNLQCGMGSSCCIVNGPRGYLALMDALAVERKDGVDLNLYLASEATVKTPAGAAKLVVSGDFPHGDEVKVRLENVESPKSSAAVVRPSSFVQAKSPCDGSEWALRLRIPAYCRKPTAKVNGEAVADVKAGGYLALRRAWKAGDEIVLTLDQPFKMVFKNRRVAFVKGCVVLARADKFNDGPIEEPILYPPEKVPEFAPIASPDGVGMAYSAKLLLGEYTCDKKLRGERSVGFSDWASAADKWGERCAVWLPIPENPEYELSHSSKAGADAP